MYCGNSSVGRAQPCQGWGREFESRFPLKRRSSPNGLLFLFDTMTRPKRPHSPLPGVGGVNIVREKLPTRSAGSSLVFRSKRWRQLLAVFFRFAPMENCARPKRPHSPLPGDGGVNTTREKLPTPWARLSFSAQRVQIKKDKVTKNLFETLFQRGFLIFGPIVQNPKITYFWCT